MNGNLHHIVPGRLLAFPPPVNDLPHLGVAAVIRIGPDLYEGQADFTPPLASPSSTSHPASNPL